MLLAFPTPSSSALEIGPLTIHYYALCIITGVAVAIWLGDKRFRAATPLGAHVVSEVAITAVPAGVIGGRIYHVISSPSAYFGSNGHPIDALKIWEGGLGIWGAISLGFLGAFLRYRGLQKKIVLPSFAVFADALAPGIVIAQAIGRFGNWFNAELFGRPLDAPWALEIARYARPDEYLSYSTFHPTFLYESLWCCAIGILLLTIGSRLRAGQTFALYVTLYCLGRLYFEFLRVDTAHLIFGIRLNILVAGLVGVGALTTFLRISRTSR
mgnify:CR=1 FL=1